MTNSASVGRVATLLGLLVALTVIGSSAVAVALPQVSADLDLDTSGAAWILAAFSLAFSISTAVFGRLADLYGLRLPLRVGGIMFAAGSLASALAPSFAVIVAARLLQGAGAGAVPVLSLGIIAARFDDSTRSRALAGITVVVSIVSGSGPLIGGAITEWLGWRYVLGIPVLALVLTEPIARLAPPSGRRPGTVDLGGAVLVGLAVTGGALLLQSPSMGLGPLAALVFAALLFIGLGLLARHVRRHPDGFLPRKVIADRRLMLGSTAGLTLLAAYIALLFAVPKLLAAGYGWGPLRIGVTMVPAAMFGAVVSRTVGVLSRPGHQHVIAAVLAAGSAVGLLLGAIGGEQRPVLLVAGLALVAAGFAGGQVAIIDGISGSVDPAVRGVALGVFNLLFFIGGTVGAAAAGGLSTVLSLPGALGVLAILPATGALLCLRIPHVARPSK